MGEEHYTIKNRPPRRLYRFRSTNTPYFDEELELCLSRKLYLAALEVQNDPFECLPSYEKSSFSQINEYIDEIRENDGKYVLLTGTNLLSVVDGSHQSLARLNKFLRKTPKRARRFAKSAETIYQEQRRKHGIACFCSQVSSQLMWAHYTSAFTGIAIVYEWNFEPLIAGDSLNPIKMRYVKCRPKVTTVDLLRMGRRQQSIFDSLTDEAQRDTIIDSMYFTKSADWSYEREWRVFGIGKTGYQTVNSMKPTAIILGANCQQSVCDKVRAIVSGKLEVVSSRISSTEYAVRIPPHLLPEEADQQA